MEIGQMDASFGYQPELEDPFGAAFWKFDDMQEKYMVHCVVL